MILIAAVVLALTPWKGPSLPTVSSDAVKYRLSVRGDANQTVRLKTQGVPNGWIASFCTSEVCSPLRYTLHLDAKGSGVLEFQAIRLERSAPSRARLTVRSDDGVAARVDVVVP